MQFSVSVAPGGTLSVSYRTSPSEPSVPITPDGAGNYTLSAGIGQVSVEASNTIILNDNYPHSFVTGLLVTVNKGHTWGAGTPVGNGMHTHSCTVAGCGASETVSCSDTDGDCKCDDCQASIHTWQFTKPDSGTLKATCNPGCSIGTVTATLFVGPVTLPDSPFKAKLTVSDNFKEAFPNAVIGDPVYRRKGPGESVYTEVDPTDPNLKAGDYQVSVHISGLPGRRNEDAELMSAGAQSASVSEYDLTVDYTVTEEAGHRHDWRLSQPDTGTMTISCAAPDCPKGSVTVNLSARSVTLPDSPFNAVVTGGEALRKAFPGAEIGELVYKYKGDRDSEYRVVAPTAANAIAGQYQVGVRVTGLPTTAGYADLYVKYTAADPAVTAQTGDNRPIELMMVGAAVFSALAAAAFVIDSKRRYQR